MTVFVGQEMVNFPAPQKLDPKISPHGTHIYDSVCGAGSGQFSCPTLPHKNSTPSPKIEPKPWYFRCLCKTQHNKRSKNTAICDTFATQHVRNAVFCENTCMKHRKYQRIQSIKLKVQTAGAMPHLFTWTTKACDQSAGFKVHPDL